MNINKTIHEAMGGHWQEGEVTQHLFRPDYTVPVHYCKLMDWMREGGRATLFSTWLQTKSDRLQVYCFISHWLEDKPQEQVTLIAEAIEAGVLK